MATPTQIRQAVNDRLATLWAAIQAKEDAYALAHGGRYWQGLITRSIIPADGVSELPDVGTQTPTDQPDPWPLALRQSTMPMTLTIDVYEGPLGKGYQATVKVIILGRIWARTAQVGQETWRVKNWADITSEVTL